MSKYILLVALLTMSAACDSDDPGERVGQGHVSLSIKSEDQTVDFATAKVGALRSSIPGANYVIDTVQSIRGIEYSIHLSFPELSEVPTEFDLALDNSTTAVAIMYAEWDRNSTPPNQIYSPSGLITGSAQVTEFDGTRLKGTFSGDLSDRAGFPDSIFGDRRQLCAGEFDVTF